MELCFLVSGIPRSFYNHLHLFFIELNKQIKFDVYINFSEDNDNNYSNTKYNLNILNNFSFYKSIITTKDMQYDKTKKEENILNQWNRIQTLFNSINNSYTHYIRIRPDLKILLNHNDFIQLIKELNIKQLNIPNGYDFYNSYHLTNDNNCVNDQIAIGNRETMIQYCNFFNYIKIKDTTISSEKDLYIYLKLNNITVNRIILPYKLILSECKVISIAGDSGSGKSTLVNALESLLFDSSVTLETDRYHKWERTSEMWKKYSHLHPEANYLEKMSEDVFRLKLGETIFSINYDHSTGKFTEKEKIESKPFLLLCGLHTLYQEKIRDIIEIKIFLDIDYKLKKEWKIKRDVEERKHSLESVLKSIEKRKSDFIKYIEPQKLYSNIIIEYNNDNFIIHINNELNYYVNSFLCQISNIKTNIYNNFYSYIIDQTKINDNLFYIFIKNKDIINKLKQYPLNIIQTIVYLCLFND
uniref:phosphoribulokinase n=1 Tax=viral metagenome TaxID=1070528 RepID=A0A6C0D5R3_9ZZZZ